MVIEDLQDLRVADPDRALRLFGMVDEHQPPPRGSDEVRAGDQADRAVLGIERDRGAVVALLDLL